MQARIANFRKHQERFEREREEYCAATLTKLRAAIRDALPPSTGRKVRPEPTVHGLQPGPHQPEIGRAGAEQGQRQGQQHVPAEVFRSVVMAENIR